MGFNSGFKGLIWQYTFPLRVVPYTFSCSADQRTSPNMNLCKVTGIYNIALR